MQAQYILVSFCNLPTPNSHPLLCVKIPHNLEEPASYVPVVLGYPELINSAIGLTKHQDKVFVLFWSNPNYYLAALSQYNLEPVYYQELPGILDGHSILTMDTKLYIVSTGTDEVISYDIVEGGVRNPQTVWQASSLQKDTHHINSIVKLNGELIVSAFGPKTGDLWSSASNGYIHNITRDSRIKEGIFHPHTLLNNNNNLYYCESSKRSFCSIDDTIFELSGYTRGCGWLSDEIICLATSIGRKISKSTGIIANPAEPGEPSGTSQLVLKNINTKNTIDNINLSPFGTEVYDILILDKKIDLQNLICTAQIADQRHFQILLSQRQTLQDIHNSNSWKLILLIRKIRNWLLPPDSP